MKNIFKLIPALAVLVLAASCNEPYDPIGPNKPAPVVIISPIELAYSGDGGELTSTISTNAEKLILGTLPEWVESAVVSDDKLSLKVKVKANTDEDAIRRGIIPITAESGDNSATQYVKLYQAAKDADIFFEGFTGKTYATSKWTPEDPSKIAWGNGYLSFTSDGEPGYLMTCNELVYPSSLDQTKGNKFYCSVDMKMNGGEGGLKLYINDDPNQVVEIYFSYNSSTNRGGIWVKNGPEWCAMDDGTIGSGDCPNKYRDVYAIPDAAERDDWWRLVFTNIGCEGWQNGIVEVISLKTFNGETKELKPHYSRLFDFFKENPGKIALWSRGNECQFKNFVFSDQRNR